MTSRALRVMRCAFILTALVVPGSCAADRSDDGAAPAQRIVSLVPSASEVLLALGAADRITGRTAYDDQPSIARARNFGATLQPSAEAVLALAPDVIIDADYAPLDVAPATLHGLGVQRLTTDLQTTDDVLALIDTLGALIGDRTAAVVLRARIMKSLDSLRTTLPSLTPSVAFLVWTEPPRTISARGYLAEILSLAGARNAFPELASAWPELSLESLLERNPDIIVISTGGRYNLEQLRRREGWRDLAAVRTGRVVDVPQDLFHRPGPRIPEAAVWLRRALHPESS